LPEAEFAAGEVRIIEDRVEAGRVFVVRVAVAARPESRDAEAGPVAVITQFERGHLAGDVLLAVADRVAAVAAERQIEGVRDVVADDVAVAVQAEIDAGPLVSRGDAGGVGLCARAGAVEEGGTLDGLGEVV